MKNNRTEIAQRLRGARDAAGISAAETARALNLTASLYEAYESGDRDIPMGALPQFAALFGMDAAAILTGGDSHAKAFSVTRKGKGAIVERQKAYHYENLASGFSRARMEPYIVTVVPRPGESFHLNSHAGQEFNRVMHGQLELMIDGKTLVLKAGDSIYFDSSLPHGMRAMNDKPVKFLAIITT
jgi:mannose-6-phosphate isomerase-like protein (cupin superfamily)